MSALPIGPLVCALIGALVYVLAANGKAQEFGRAGFWVGLFWTIGHYAGVAIG